MRETLEKALQDIDEKLNVCIDEQLLLNLVLTKMEILSSLQILYKKELDDYKEAC